MLAPILSILSWNNGTLTNPLPFSTTVANQQGLPVLVGEPSDHTTIRVYNNYSCIAGVANAYNIQFQTFDSSASSTQPVAQNWLHLMQTGFGQNSTAPASYTMYFETTDTAVGNSMSAYIPSWGSDGNPNPMIYAGNGCGMIELDAYIFIPVDVTIINTTYIFSLQIIYDWSS